MKRMVIGLLLGFVFLCSGEISLADFKVLAKKGDIAIQNPNSNEWILIKIGSSITDNQTVKISKYGYLLLIHSNGRTLELSKQGTYQLSPLSKKILEQNSFLSSRFTAYLLKELGGSNEILPSENYRKSMTTSGGVERSFNLDCKPQKSQNKDDRKYLTVNYPKSCFLTNGVVEFKWNNFSGASSYELRIANNKEETIFSKKTDQTNLKVDLSKIPIDNGSCYSWKVVSGNNSSESNCIYLLTKSEIALLNDTLSIIKKENNSLSKSALNLIIGAFLRRKEHSRPSIALLQRSSQTSTKHFRFQHYFGILYKKCWLERTKFKYK